MMSSYRKTLLITLVCLVVFSIIEIPTGFFKTKAYLLLTPEDTLKINLKAYPEGYALICADGHSPVLLDVILFDSSQNPVPYSAVSVTTNHFSAGVKPKHPVTDKDGRVVISIYPEDIPITNDGHGSDKCSEVLVSVNLKAKKSAEVRWEGKLTYPPVLMVHGFQDSSESMIPLKNYLSEKGFLVYTMDYATETNIDAMSAALEKALSDMKKDLKAKGIYAQKVDIIAHSLGGLVSRYYTSGNSFIQKQDVRKLIFINVPHHGTPWAEAGAELLNAPFLKELYPTSSLYTSVFPNSINHGLNHTLQIANIALENDEVVPLPSSMLTSWRIETKIYRIGSEPLNLESVIINPMRGSSRHRQLLFYTPVFEEIFYVLTNKLTYPQKIN